MSNRSIKIAHLTSSHPRNDVRINVKMCRSLINAGFDTSLVVADGLADEVDSGLKIYNCVGKKKKRLGRILQSSRAVYKKAVQLDCDVYHLHDPELLIYANKLKNLGKKVIFDAHEDFPKQLLSKSYLNKFVAIILSRIASRFEKYVCIKLDTVIGATPLITKKFSGYVNAVNINNYPILGELVSDSSVSQKEREIIYLGGISKIRGIREVVESLEYVNNVTLNLVGNISSSELREELTKLKGWIKVKEHGLVDRKRAATIMSHSRVGIVTFLPVPNHVESQPNKMFEYMSAGLPIVSSNFELWKAIVEDNHCGICVDPTEPKAIAEAIQKILNDEPLAKYFAQNGHECVNKKYNWGIEEEKLINLYLSL